MSDQKDLLEQKHHRMTTAPVRSLVLKMAVPTIISMMISAVYNLTDTWFISHIPNRATHAIAAVGVIFSYMAIVQATGFFFGHGSGNYISRALGRKDIQNASRMASTGVITSFILGTIIMIAGLLFPVPLLKFIGASDEVMTECIQYFKYISLATPFMTTSLVFNNQLRLQGNARRGMIGIAVGGILNIVLDPLCIFTFEMGVSGASLATAISQTVGFFILLTMTHRGDSIAPKWRYFSPSIKNYREILAGGLPSLARQSLNAIAAIVMNRYALDYGAHALAGVSIVARIMSIVFCIIVGIGQGFQPVCGYNYGAQQYDRVKQAYYETIRMNTIVCIIFFFILNTFAAEIVALFGASQDATEIAGHALHYQTVSLPILGFVVTTEMLLQNTRQTIKASVLAMMRRGLAYAPCIIVLNFLFELDGILWSKTAADYISLCFAIPFCIVLMRDMNHTKHLES